MQNILPRLMFVLGVSVLAVLGAAAPAAAKSYSAERFDSVVRVLPDGTLDVTESVVFRFEDGTFKEVFREIPLRRTDGIDVVRAEMQGEPMPFGTETGTVEVRRRNGRVRIVWRFRPVEDITRRFVLNYRVRGAVRRESGADLLMWRGTPGEHGYAIDSSTIRFDLPVSPLAPPVVTTRKTAPAAVNAAGTVVEVRAADVRPHGWIDTAIRFPAGSVAAVAPAWQQHATQVQAQSPLWITSAGLIVAAGLILLVAWRQSYDAPPPETERGRDDWRQPSPPDVLRPALGGVVAGNGRATLEHAMAALFALADRGEIEIQEKPRGVMLGQRDFVLTRRAGGAALGGHERLALDIIFKNEPGPGATVLLSQARSRITRGFSKFTGEVDREMAAAGLLDEARRAIRHRYNRAGAWSMVLAAVSALPTALQIPRYGAWPLLIPAALVVVGVGALIFGTTITPLSNDGVRRAHHWRQYRKYLTTIAQGKQHATGLNMPAVLPYAIALGLASAWSKFLKTQHHSTPAWFHALSSGPGQGGFAAFVAHGGAGSSGSGGAGGGGGAAGGGSSGAG